MTVEVTANYITELDEAFPRSRDLIREGDDHIRLIKSVLKTTFPQFRSSVNMTSDKLNYINADINHDGRYLTFNKDIHFVAGSGILMQDGFISGVASIDDNSAVQPRSYNDSRYFQISKNLSELPDPSTFLMYLFGSLTTTASNTFRAEVGKMMYPVGALFFDASTNINPSVSLGFGTWEAFGQGRVIIGAGQGNDGSETRNFTRNATGGSYRHTLTTNEMPSHEHDVVSKDGRRYGLFMYPGNHGATSGGGRTDGETNTLKAAAAGGGQPHTNIQPYIVVNVWKRIS